MATITPADTDADIHCPECDYNLTGAPANRCPWCGWPIDLETLLRASSRSDQGRRLGVIAAALIVGVGTLFVMYSLTVRGRRFSVFDLIAITGTTAAALSHIALASWILLWWRQRWPLRRGDFAVLLRWAALCSIAAGVIGAVPALSFAPTKLVVQNTVVNGPLEFLLSAMLFTLPAGMLFVLRMITFRPSREGVLAKNPDRLSSAPSVRAPFFVESIYPHSPAQLTQRWSAAPRSTSPLLETTIAQTWEVEMSLAREFNRLLFNGKLVRLIHARANPHSLFLELGPTDYRDFVGTNLLNLPKTLHEGPEFLSDALGVSATVITSDGFLAFGRRSDRVASHAGKLHAFGGMLEATDRTADGACDVFSSVQRELGEELNLRADEVTNLVITGLVRDRDLYQPELLFDAPISLTRDALLRRFDKSLSHGEHEGLEVVRDEPDSILPFLEHTPDITPVTQAAMLLHGRHQWGIDWYEQACFLLYGELPSATPARPIA